MLAQEIQTKLAGVFAPICTPFAPNEDVDHGALRFNLARYAESGILGYLALGSNGENRSLSEDERLRVLDDVVRHKGSGPGGDGRRRVRRRSATRSASSRRRRTSAPTSGSSCRRATSGSR